MWAIGMQRNSSALSSTAARSGSVCVSLHAGRRSGSAHVRNGSDPVPDTDRSCLCRDAARHRSCLYRAVRDSMTSDQDVTGECDARENATSQRYIQERIPESSGDEWRDDTKSAAEVYEMGMSLLITKHCQYSSVVTVRY